jgi:hypothetical protein
MGEVTSSIRFTLPISGRIKLTASSPFVSIPAARKAVSDFLLALFEMG